MEFCPRGSPAAAKVFNKDLPSDPAIERFKVNGNAIVCGGGGDLGSTACCSLLEHGLKASSSVKVHFKKVDITKEGNVWKAVEEAIVAVGPIHHLLCLAATVYFLPTADVSPNKWRRVQDINTTGGFILAQFAGRKMIAAKNGGSIVSVGGISGHKVCYPQPQAAYNVSKAGVIMLKSCLTAEWAVHGICVNTISPGYVDTIINHGEGLDKAKDVWLAQSKPAREDE